MKKYLIIFITIISINSYNFALAKTAGNFIGLSLINTELESVAYSDDIKVDQGKYNKISAGINYKYTFNYNGIFLAPEIFFDLNKSKSKANDKDNTIFGKKLKNSYGAKLNFGYDITNKFATNFIVGYSINRMNYYLSGNVSNITDTDPINYKEKAFIYGIGAKYDLLNNISINFSYEMFQFYQYKNLGNLFRNTNPNYRITRLGFAYNF